MPPGSRIATGRINFRLLAREATSRKLAFAVVSPDEQVRALAIAGGVVARASVDEAEGALDRGEPAAPASASGVDHDARRGRRTGPPTTATWARPGRTLGWQPTPAHRGDLGHRGRARPRRRLGRIPLPAERIDSTIEPERVTLGPILVSVKAAPGADAIDVSRGEILAGRSSIPLTVKATFAASGRETSETPARGQVVFSSSEQAVEQPIAAGTRVATPDGVEFQTTQAVSLRPPDSGAGPSEVRVPVEAVVAGPEGNVEAGTITQTSLGEFGVTVTNPDPTAGGERQATPFVTQADYDAAAIDLQNRLAGELARQLRDPTIAPEGLTLFAETARLGDDRGPPGR